MRILGIDVGKSSIKAVEIDSAFGRYEIHEYHETPLPPGGDPEEPLKILIDGLQKQPDRIVVGVPAKDVTFRNLQLPTRDKKAIQAGVGFELDDELPFPMESAVYDFSILSQSKAGSFLHVAATLKSRVASLMSYWLKMGIDPDLVTTETWAYRSLLNRIISPAEQERPTFLVQIGHERTVIYAHWKGAPLFSKEIPWGGSDLTLAICKKYQIPLEQAEQAKRDHAFVVPRAKTGETTPEQIEMSKTLKEALQPLILELKTSELTCKSSSHLNAGFIYLAGGTALLPGLTAVLEEDLGLSVRPLHGLSAIATSGVTYSEQADATMALASALAISLVGDRASMLNFRKNEFAKLGRSHQMNLETLKRPILAAIAVGCCMFTSLLIQSGVYQSQLRDVDERLERGVKTFFGSLSPSAVRTYMSNTTTLRASITRELTKQRELSKIVTFNSRSPIEFLKQLSGTVPKDVQADMILFQVGSAPEAPYSSTADTTASLTFLAPDQSQADRLKGIVLSKFRGLQAGKVEQDPKEMKWKVTFTGKLNEAAYGL